MTEEYKLSPEDEQLRDILLRKGVSKSHVRIALQRKEATNETVTRIMQDFGFLSGEQVAEVISEIANLEYFPSSEIESVDKDAMLEGGIRVEKYNRFVPVKIEDDGTLVIIVPEEAVINRARNEFPDRTKVKILIASENTCQTVYRRVYAKSAEQFDELVAKFMKSLTVRKSAEEDDGQDATLLADLFGSLLRHAAYSGASDLYLYKSEFVGIIKIKVNGTGQIFRTIEAELFDRILNKLATENTKVEDLRKEPKESILEFTDADKKKFEDITSRYGFRLELTESRQVRNAVIRLLDKQGSATSLDKLGVDEVTLRTVRRISNSATGLFLVTGPTGSGKTTMLYAVLSAIDPVERSIQSIEDPIEYRHGLWQQYELRKDATDKGKEYNNWLKALLRNAPDVILVGEVRDAEVAAILIDAANTGHLAFATLHTNNATLALARLKRLGVDMDTLASVLLGIFAQRLIRVLCPKCKQPEDRKEVFNEIEEASYLANVPKTLFKKGIGCNYCGFSGYRGRRSVYELLEMNFDVQRLIEENAPPSVIAAAGIKQGYSMWGCGLKLIASGVTDFEEIERIAKKDQTE